mmetsp:Transcript_66891/g.199027  ORF Transcript_66891/g.199027 Transcript_66891/m.199027 type:complete len:210 (+) Transcript_66891:935-1564(+)
MRSPLCNCTHWPHVSSSMPFTMVHDLLRFATKKEHGRPPAARLAGTGASAACVAQIWKCSRDTMLRRPSSANTAWKNSSCGSRPTLNSVNRGAPGSCRCDKTRCSEGMASRPSTNSHSNDHNFGISLDSCPSGLATCCRTGTASGACAPARRARPKACASGLAPTSCLAQESGASRSLRSALTTSVKHGRCSSSAWMQCRARLPRANAT